MTSSGKAPATAIWTRKYVSLVVVVLLVYANNMALLPVIPLYVAHIGGSELLAGVVLATFSIASFVLRPRIGRMVDAWDAGWVVLSGCVLLGAATVGMLVPALVLVVIANILRGIGWAAVNTGSHVLLARLAPLARRGEASGYFSLFMALGSLLGPPLALHWLTNGGGFGAVLLTCGGCAAAAALVARPLRRSHPEVAAAPTAAGDAYAAPGDAAASSGDARGAPGGTTTPAAAARGAGRGLRPRRRLIARSAVLPAVLVVAVMTTQPAVLGFVPLYAERSGVPATGVTAFYLVCGVSALLARAMLGRASDWLGRGILILGGFALMTVSLVALASATTIGPLLVVGALYAVGQGMTLPVLTAAAIARADASETGLAMATFSASYQVGLGAGGLLSGALISGVGYQGLYATMACVSVAGAAVTVRRWSQLQRTNTT